MVKNDMRGFAGTRMRASVIKRSRLKGVCRVCGKPVKKPRRGPTARFCGSACRQAYALRERAAADSKKRLLVEQAADQLTRSAEDYRTRADTKRKRILRAQEETRQSKRSSRLACMLQLKTILEYKPELIEQAATGEYVVDLMNAIDRYGMQGDAERMLRHLGYTGPIPQ
ncbi:hypothetical protein [Bifidobacterium moukalabense]|uniref:hypothetical protein n=1 Tax=Bifidobacterium moukalabense TaxID=1333651 RepID=UPI0010F5381D|nr:hypothetical protein [Bifidobacterium moukalabense]